MTDILNVYDHPVRDYLRTYLKQSGHNPNEFEPIIAAAFEQAKKTTPDEFRDYDSAVLLGHMKFKSKGYLQAVLTQEDKWKDCRESVKAFYSVFLIGAGLSYDSDMPLVGTLHHVLEFCEATGWAELRSDPKKCLKFKQTFKQICKDKSPSAAHSLLIDSYPNIIWEIICLNWDDLLEKAASMSSKVINKCNKDISVLGERYLWKFHGDVGEIRDGNIVGQGGWVFPDEQGYVFNCFRDYIKRTGLDQRMFTFVIVGYSETESKIYDQIVSFFELNPKRPTFRIGLDLRNLNEKYYIVGTAEFTMRKVLPN